MTDTAVGAVTVRREASVHRVTLTRPEAYNSLRPEVLDALHRAVDTAEQDNSCRALVLDAEGEYFCAGLDLGYARLPMVRFDGDADATYWRLLNRLRETPVVTASVVDGWVTGGGVGLACACDLVAVGDEARFRLTEVFLGLVPAMLMPPLARRAGEQRVFRMALLAEELDADEAVRAGLADLRAGRGSDALRQLLTGLRRTDRATLADLKTARRLLFPVDDSYGLYAGRLLGRRLDDPEVQARIDRFRSEGMLS